MENKFKIGDWVIGWHSHRYGDRDTVAWKIDRFSDDEQYVYTGDKKKGNTTGIIDIRLAFSHEIPKEFRKNKEYSIY